MLIESSELSLCGRPWSREHCRYWQNNIYSPLHYKHDNHYDISCKHLYLLVIGVHSVIFLCIKSYLSSKLSRMHGMREVSHCWSFHFSVKLCQNIISKCWQCNRESSCNCLWVIGVVWIWLVMCCADRCEDDKWTAERLAFQPAPFFPQWSYLRHGILQWLQRGSAILLLSSISAQNNV